MKKVYFNPEVKILVLADKDVLTMSPLSVSTNSLGDDDGESIDQMFKT